MKTKRLLSMLMCAAMAAGSLAGCTGSDGAASKGESPAGSGNAASMSANGEFPIVNEKMTFTIMSPQMGYILDLNTNEFTKWYEEKTNVHIQYDLFPADAAKEKINLALTSGDYADAFLGCNISATDQVKYGSQGIFLPLNSLIDQYSVDFKAAMDPVGILPNSITTPDGNIYALPTINECYHCFYPGKMYINQTWLDHLNLETPTTTDELYNVLMA